MYMILLTVRYNIKKKDAQLTAFGLQELPGDDNSVEPGCVVEGSKALLVESIDLVSPSWALDTALKKGVQQVH